MHKHIGLALALVAANVSAPSWAERPPTLSASEMVAAQSRMYSVAPKVAFNAVLSTLQTLGYLDVSANRDAGIATGKTEAKAKTIYNFFWGFGKKKWTQTASLLVEESGSGSRVRLNLLLSETKARGIFGTSFTDGALIRTADPYIDFFHVLDGEIAQRGGGTGAEARIVPDASGALNLGTVSLRPARTASGYCISAPPGYQGTGAGNSPAVTSARPLC